MGMAYISLGSNLGNSLETLQKALLRLNENPKITVKAVSSFYKTAPVGYAQQPDFVNACTLLMTSIAPLDLLDILLDLEQEFKRVRLFKNGPRTLDLDLLLYDDTVMQSDKLILPHPRMHERAFVLVPLNEIAPNLFIKSFNQTVNSLYKALDSADIQTVKKIDHA